jgi:DNA processing protein
MLIAAIKTNTLRGKNMRIIEITSDHPFVEQINSSFANDSQKIKRLRIATRDETTINSLHDFLPEQGLGIVGSRAPQVRSQNIVRTITKEIAAQKPWIVSGLALGIDGVAHQAALDNGLRTIAVLGGGILELYPSQHMSLARNILNNGGLIISEYDDYDKPLRGCFVRRNRIIAALSKAVWVVQANPKSGSLETANIS